MIERALFFKIPQDLVPFVICKPVRLGLAFPWPIHVREGVFVQAGPRPLSGIAHHGPGSARSTVAYGVVKLKNSGHGIFGGYPGAPSVVELSKGSRLCEQMNKGRRLGRPDKLGGQKVSLPYCAFELNEDDVLYTRQSSGGGYGDPLECDPKRVLNDVTLGLISVEAARDVYGVCLQRDSQTLNVEATDRLRGAMRSARLGNNS